MPERAAGRRPGDLILDRYMPNASTAEREEARNNLRAYARVLIRIGERLAAEARDSRESGGDATICA